jgi:hypothetical protein
MGGKNISDCGEWGCVYVPWTFRRAVSHFGTAALGAAVVGAGFTATVLAVSVANRRLSDPHELDFTGIIAVAGGGLVSGGLFAVMGAEQVGAWLSVSWVQALLLSFVALLSIVAVGTMLFQPMIYRYLRWARTPSVLREERQEGFEP